MCVCVCTCMYIYTLSESSNKKNNHHVDVGNSVLFIYVMPKQVSRLGPYQGIVYDKIN